MSVEEEILECHAQPQHQELDMMYHYYHTLIQIMKKPLLRLYCLPFSGNSSACYEYSALSSSLPEQQQILQ